MVIPKAQFQDTYRELKLKYQRWTLKWNSAVANTKDGKRKQHGIGTDPQKHVFEDVAIVTFLSCLWRQSATDVKFVDMGCGNGFLTHLLAQEGWHGYGFD